MKAKANKVLIAVLLIIASVTIASARVHGGRVPSLQAVYESAEYREYAACFQLGLSGSGLLF